MDFSFDDDFTDLAELTRTILADHVTPARLTEVEATGDRFDRALWTDLAKAGVLSAALPASVGGSGLGLLDQCGVLVEIGRTVAPVPYLCSARPAAFAERASASASWRLHGTKVAVPAGPVADLFLVPAETSAGLTVFLVTPNDPGVHVRRQEIVDGDAEAILELNNVSLDADRVLR